MMIKRIIAVLLVIITLIGLLPAVPLSNMTAEAASVASGSCGDNLTWNLNDEGTLTISGTGAMTDYKSAYYGLNAPWSDYNDDIISVVVNDGVTRIGDDAFYQCRSLTNITLPSSVESIGKAAFAYCTSLENINIPKNLKNIDDLAFYVCENISEITLPASVTSIGDNAFLYCDLLEQIIFEGDAPEFTSSVANNVDIYYPKNAAGWASVTAASFGSNINLIPYTDLQEAINKQNTLISGGAAADGCYKFADGIMDIGSTSSTIRMYPCEEKGGIYFLLGSSLKFLDLSNGAVRTVRNFGGSKYYYDEQSQKLYSAQNNIVTIFSLSSEEIIKTVKINGIDSIDAVGADSKGRIYAAGYDSQASRVKLSLYSASGELLSSVYSDNEIYSFNGFDSSSGNFYMESEYNWIYWGYDHYGNALTMGNVTNNKISLVGTEGSVTISGLLNYSLECLEYLCQDYYLNHQIGAELLAGKYLVSSSITYGRVLVMDPDDTSVLWAISRNFDDSSDDDGYYDNTSVGVRAVYIDNHDSILMWTDDKKLVEYDAQTQEKYDTYTPAHHVFIMSKMGDTVVLLEKEGEDWYLELVDWSDPETVTVSGKTTMAVGDKQILSANTSVMSWTSSDPSIASVTKDGIVAAWKTGTATITVSTIDGKSAKHTIKVTAGKNTGKNSILNLGGTVTDNCADNDYTVWSKVVNSYLSQNNDGTLSRVEYIDGKGVVVETYSTGGQLKGSKTITAELPIFGGFFSGKDYNFLVFGQTNPNDSNNTEVLRIVKYSKSWERLGSCSVSGANTYIPFDAGSLRMDETAGKLYIHTCHEMYASDDGVHHQANMTYVLNQSSMKVVDSYYDVLNISQAGYVSHSFNQFIRTDGEYVYRIDHGDANPRAVSITRCDVDGNITDVRYNYAHSINGGHDANATGVSVGGFELSTNKCIIVGNSVDMSDPDEYDARDKRNIFVSILTKNLGEVELKWLTNSKDSSIIICTPHLVKLSDEHFLVMWEEFNTNNYRVTVKTVTINSDGKIIASASSDDLMLSDCQPIVTSDGAVRWYVSDGAVVRLYKIDPYNLTAISTMASSSTTTTTTTTRKTTTTAKPTTTTKKTTTTAKPTTTTKKTTTTAKPTTTTKNTTTTAKPTTTTKNTTTTAKPTTTTKKTTTTAKPTTTKTTTTAKPTTTTKKATTTAKPTTTTKKTTTTAKPTTTTTKKTTTTAKPTTTTKKTTTTTATGPISNTFTRLAGKGRCETAVEISKASYKKAANVIIASGDDYADALAGVPLAYALDAPILLIRNHTLDDTTLGEIKRLGAKNVYILGGEFAVNAKVAKTLTNKGYKVSRLAGSDRFGTSLEIAKKLQSVAGKPSEIIFVYSHNYPDALAVSGVAAAKECPVIYIAGTGKLTDGIAAFVKSSGAKNATIISGPAIVSSAAEGNIKKAGISSVKRIYGANRYETCIKINEAYAKVLTGKTVCVATGTNYPDALAGGVFAAIRKAPLVLVDKSLTDSQKKYIKSKNAKDVYVFGGTSVVSDKIAKEIAKY